MKIHPGWLFTISIAMMTLLGGFLLMLPEMSRVENGIDFIDSLFLSMSSVSVTGLTTVDVANTLTFKGQIVVLVLIKLGGLNTIAFGALMLVVAKFGVGIKYHKVIEDFVNNDSILKAGSMLAKIVIWATTIEVIGIILLFGGFFLVGMFGWFNGTVGNILTITISLLIVSFFYFYLPKTKLYKNRGKAKQPIEDGTNLMFRLIGQGIMLVGAGHILFAIYVWLRSGVWTKISLGDWGLTVFKLDDLGRFDTGWWAANKVLNYIILDSSAALPIMLLGYIIYIGASDD